MYKKLMNEIQNGEITGIRSRICIAIKNGRLSRKQLETLLASLEKTPQGKNLFFAGKEMTRKNNKSEWDMEYLNFLCEQEVLYGINKKSIYHMADVSGYVYRFYRYAKCGLICAGLLLILKIFVVLKGG